MSENHEGHRHASRSVDAPARTSAAYLNTPQPRRTILRLLGTALLCACGACWIYCLVLWEESCPALWLRLWIDRTSVRDLPTRIPQVSGQTWLWLLGGVLGATACWMLHCPARPPVSRRPLRAALMGLGVVSFMASSGSVGAVFSHAMATLTLRLAPGDRLAAWCIRGVAHASEANHDPDSTYEAVKPDDVDLEDATMAFAACEAACERGVRGSGGCATVGENLASFGHAGIPFEGPSIPCTGNEAAAIPYLTKACDYGRPMDCLLAGDTAQWLGDSFPLGGHCPDIPPAFPFFERGCSFGHIRSCDRTASNALLRDPQRAREALVRQCSGDPQCAEQAGAFVDSVSAAHLECESADAHACSRLGKVLLERKGSDGRSTFRDLARGALSQECRIRGLDAADIFPRGDTEPCDCAEALAVRLGSQPSACDVFLRARPPRAMEPRRFGRLSLTVAEVSVRGGSYPKAAIDALVQSRLPDVERCQDSGSEVPLLAAHRIDVHLVVDRMGEAHVLASPAARWDPRLGPQAPSVLDCTLRSFDTATLLSPAAGIRDVLITLEVTPVASSTGNSR